MSDLFFLKKKIIHPAVHPGPPAHRGPSRMRQRCHDEINSNLESDISLRGWKLDSLTDSTVQYIRVKQNKTKY